MELEGKVSVSRKEALLMKRPKYAVLCLLDKIFDYLDFEDLEKMATVCKVSCPMTFPSYNIPNL